MSFHLHLLVCRQAVTHPQGRFMSPDVCMPRTPVRAVSSFQTRVRCGCDLD